MLAHEVVAVFHLEDDAHAPVDVVESIVLLARERDLLALVVADGLDGLSESEVARVEEHIVEVRSLLGVQAELSAAGEVLAVVGVQADELDITRGAVLREVEVHGPQAVVVGEFALVDAFTVDVGLSAGGIELEVSDVAVVVVLAWSVGEAAEGLLGTHVDERPVRVLLRTLTAATIVGVPVGAVVTVDEALWAAVDGAVECVAVGLDGPVGAVDGLQVEVLVLTLVEKAHLEFVRAVLRDEHSLSAVCAAVDDARRAQLAVAQLEFTSDVLVADGNHVAVLLNLDGVGVRGKAPRREGRWESWHLRRDSGRLGVPVYSDVDCEWLLLRDRTRCGCERVNSLADVANLPGCAMNLTADHHGEDRDDGKDNVLDEVAERHCKGCGFGTKL